MTLIEILVVVGVLGVLLAIVAPSLRRDGFAINQASTGLAATLQRARHEALYRNEFVGLRVDLTGQEYFLFVDLDRSRSFSTGDTRLAPTAVRLKHGNYGDVQLTTGNVDFVFDTRGVLRSGGGLSVGMQTVSGSRSRTITVNGQGKGTIQ